MNGDLRETEAKQKLVEVFRDSVDDIPELPPNHELQRWITATSVILIFIFLVICCTYTKKSGGTNTPGGGVSGTVGVLKRIFFSMI